VLQLPQGAVYAIIPLSGLYMAVHLVLRLVSLLGGSLEQTSSDQPSC
jgi:TRAP-type C4-dicarboxylate transport system permease small subunit